MCSFANSDGFACACIETGSLNFSPAKKTKVWPWCICCQRKYTHKITFITLRSVDIERLKKGLGLKDTQSLSLQTSISTLSIWQFFGMMHVFIIFTNKCFAVSPAPLLHVVQACWHVHVMRRGPELLKSGSVTCSLFNRSPHPGN